MTNIIKRFLNNFIWSDWKSIGVQRDRYKKIDYEIFKKTNNNGLSEYKSIKIVSSSYYYEDNNLINKN